MGQSDALLPALQVTTIPAQTISPANTIMDPDVVWINSVWPTLTPESKAKVMVSIMEARGQQATQITQVVQQPKGKRAIVDKSPEHQEKVRNAIANAMQPITNPQTGQEHPTTEGVLENAAGKEISNKTLSATE